MLLNFFKTPNNANFGEYRKNQENSEKIKSVSALFFFNMTIISLGKPSKKNPVKLGTLSQVACHPPLPTEVGTHMRKNFRWRDTPNNWCNQIMTGLIIMETLKLCFIFSLLYILTQEQGVYKTIVSSHPNTPLSLG